MKNSALTLALIVHLAGLSRAQNACLRADSPDGQAILKAHPPKKIGVLNLPSGGPIEIYSGAFIDERGGILYLDAGEVTLQFLSHRLPIVAARRLCQSSDVTAPMPSILCPDEAPRAMPQQQSSLRSYPPVRIGSIDLMALEGETGQLDVLSGMLLDNQAHVIKLEHGLVLTADHGLLPTITPQFVCSLAPVFMEGRKP